VSINLSTVPLMDGWLPGEGERQSGRRGEGEVMPLRSKKEHNSPGEPLVDKADTLLSLCDWKVLLYY